MRFVRFVVASRHPDSGLHEGPFRLAYRLRDDPAVDRDTRKLLKEIMAWFDEHLDLPSRFNSSTSKGHYRRNSRGIAWFRDSASECISRMHTLRSIFEAHGYHVTMLRESRLGYVVYEDDYQVVAEPFSETQTF
jgi:hypothetical protein